MDSQICLGVVVNLKCERLVRAPQSGVTIQALEQEEGHEVG